VSNGKPFFLDFMPGSEAVMPNLFGGGTGRLPSAGVVRYRKNLTLRPNDTGKSIFLDVDGAMAYSMALNVEHNIIVLVPCI
jgi:hypothetical protein